MTTEVSRAVIRKEAEKRRALAKTSIHSLPIEVIRIILKVALNASSASNSRPSKFRLAHVVGSWRDIALPLIWHSIKVELNQDHRVCMVERFARGAGFDTRKLQIKQDAATRRVSVDRAILAVNGLRELTLTTAEVSMSVFEDLSMRGNRHSIFQ